MYPDTTSSRTLIQYEDLNKHYYGPPDTNINNFKVFLPLAVCDE